ncbi:transmembrane protein 79 isoform X3 [Bufo gargarizans]|uniref:transmembrane protein 79 isoform X3 n=1 Tax=Bufo gargarizans TaxID=30331 RepID=UPI001CF17D9D|nr:transmembrane protein 79 isoform X3 [Bufo gargarizans]
MAGSLKVNLKPDSLEGKHIDPVGFLASRKTPEDKKKVRSVDFYELDVVKNDLEEPKTTSNVRCEVTEDKDRENLEDKKDVDSAQSNQPQENKESSNYFDQTQPSSPKLCRIKSSPTCPCKECVENYLNLRDTTEEPNVDEEKKDKAVNLRDTTEEPNVDEEKKDKAGNVRENAEEPLVDEEKKDEATPGVDRTSVRSRRVSDTSRHTDSSEDDFLGTRCEDAQVTLPYPDKNEPPECIARLSNAGLYDPSEERPGKTGDEDKISQVVINTAFFVEHPALEEQKNVRMVEYDKVDVEKGDPESEPLMRLARRRYNPRDLTSLRLFLRSIQTSGARGDHPQTLREAEHLPLRLVLLQPLSAGHLPAPETSEVYPTPHLSLLLVPADLLAILCRWTIVPRFRLRPDLPAFAQHADMQSLLYVCHRAGENGLSRKQGCTPALITDRCM